MNRKVLGWLCSAVLTFGLMATACLADDEQQQDPQQQDAVVQDDGLSIQGVSLEIAANMFSGFAGGINLNFNGMDLSGQSIADPLVLDPGPDNYGGMHGTTGHLLDLGNGNTLKTTDVVHIFASNPGFYIVRTLMTVTEGTGLFRRAQGTIEIWGIIRGDDFGFGALSYLDGHITLL